ncbi:radial spoke head protein 9 homolog [Diretmus argenteus]
MDSNSLLYSLDMVSTGYVLNVEQRAALQTSLVLLKKNYRFNRVLFWGRILGLEFHYFIAQGRGADELKDKKNFYSFDCMDWHLLPAVTEKMILDVSTAAKGRFIGDASHQYTHFETDVETGEEVSTTVTEETRLAVTIQRIDEEVSVVPRGAFTKTRDGPVQTNRCFGGLSHSEAQALDSFLHFAEPKRVRRSLLDPLSEDIPDRSWSLQLERSGNVCVIRSLLWLGLNFFHVPMTPQHGYVYMGDGCRTDGLQSML